MEKVIILLGMYHTKHLTEGLRPIYSNKVSNHRIGLKISR